MMKTLVGGSPVSPHVLGPTFVSLVFALALPVTVLAQEDAGSASKCSDASVMATSATGFPQPEIRKSSGGVLQTTLHACIGTNTVVGQPSGETRVIHTTTYEGTIPGPTLVVKPGDRLSIDLINNLPLNPKKQRGSFFPHDRYTTNLHTHGLEVSPLGNSDNIFRKMEPGTTNHIRVDIPADHPSGTFWYHPHKHGSTTYQFIGGMAGFLIIKGGPGTLDAVPEVAAAKDVPMMFQVIRTAVDGTQPFVHQVSEQYGTFPFFTNVKEHRGIWSTYGLDGAPGRSFFYFTSNGVTKPTLHMQPGECRGGDCSMRPPMNLFWSPSQAMGSTLSPWTGSRSAICTG
jgi:FtsP/CotA-like multicopper oxidase with cupredoxin domain